MKLAVSMTRSESLTLAALLRAAIDKAGDRFLIAAAEGFNGAMAPGVTPVTPMTERQADHLLKRLARLA